MEEARRMEVEEEATVVVVVVEATVVVSRVLSSISLVCRLLKL